MNTQHPGIILKSQYLAKYGLSQNRLARLLDVPPRRINEIILGKRAITADTAVRLARYFNTDPAYWMKLQTDYDIALATNNIGIHLYAIEQEEASDAAPAARSREALLPAQRNIKTRTNIKRRLLR